MSSDLATYSVVLLSAGANKIKIIKVYREVTGQGLSEGKDAVENVPSVVISGQNLETCQKVKKAFENEGAAAEIRKDSSGSPGPESRPDARREPEGSEPVGELEARSRLMSGLCPVCNMKLSFLKKCPQCGKRWKL